MPRLLTKGFFIAPVLCVFAVAAQGQAQSTNAALLVAECEARDGVCSVQHLVKYGFRKDEQVSREVILTEPTDRVRYELGENHIYKRRYVITEWGDVIDIEQKQLVHDGIGEYVGVEADRIIQKVQRRGSKGFFYYDLKSGKYSRLKSPGKWALPGSLSPDQTKTIAANQFGHGEIWLHHLNGRKRLLASGLGTFSIGCDFPMTLFLWLNDQEVLTQRADGKLVVVDMRGRVTPLLSLPIDASADVSAHLYRDDHGQIIYEFGNKTYTIDVQNKQYTLLDSAWVELGFGFEREPNNSADGTMIRFRQKEIGRWWVSSARTTTDHIVVEYGDIGSTFGIPKGMKVWSSSNNKWTTIDPVWLTRIIGWIE